MSSHPIRPLAAGILALGLAGAADAAYVINEVVSETPGPNHQFVELFTDTPGESTTGLSLVVIRTFGGDGSGNQPTFFARVDLAGSPAGGGQFFLVANEPYLDTPGRPTPDQVVLTVTEDAFFVRAGVYEMVLVQTADIDPAWTTEGHIFTGAEFSNGAAVIDAIYKVDDVDIDDFRVFAPLSGIIPDDFGFISAGAFRDGDGTGPWVGMTFPGGQPDGTFPPEATPRASNTGETSVDDWTRY